MKEDGGGWALPFLLTPLSFLAPMGSLRVSQCSSSILSPFLGQSLRAPWRAVPLMLGVGPAGEGLPACPPDPKAFDHEACWHRQPSAVFAHQTSPSDKPRRELRVLGSSCCRQQEKFGVRRRAKPGRWVPEEENASRAAKTCSGPGGFFFGIAVSKVRLRCCIRESIYFGTSSFPRLVGSSLLSRHNPLIAFWKPEQHFFKKKICLWWQGLQGHVSRSTAQVHH